MASPPGTIGGGVLGAKRVWGVAAGGELRKLTALAYNPVGWDRLNSGIEREME
jgi:hypothetical protein